MQDIPAFIFTGLLLLIAWMLLATFRSERSLEADPDSQQKERLTTRPRKKPEGEWLARAKKESSLLGKELARPESDDAEAATEPDHGVKVQR